MTGKEMYESAKSFMQMRLYYIDEDEDDTGYEEITACEVNTDWKDTKNIIIEFEDGHSEDNPIEISINSKGEFEGLGDNLFINEQDAINVVKNRLEKRLKQLG